VPHVEKNLAWENFVANLKIHYKFSKVLYIRLESGGCTLIQLAITILCCGNSYCPVLVAFVFFEVVYAVFLDLLLYGKTAAML